jgi:hypothetical protein
MTGCNSSAAGAIAALPALVNESESLCALASSEPLPPNSNKLIGITMKLASSNAYEFTNLLHACTQPLIEMIIDNVESEILIVII